MPHRECARKSLRQNASRRLRNKGVKSRLGTETRKFLRAVERGDVQEAKGQLSLLTKLLQKASAKGVMHANTVARRQALLHKRLNQVETAATG
ncbi:MAG: 30S ribosomal protein S20 [Candidatus Brocadiia bacterium]|jgi:small subunit ribosomal protein S20|nr:30S ribosomal protein S20 [Candidatus Brocadiia bacterium]